MTIEIVDFDFQVRYVKLPEGNLTYPYLSTYILHLSSTSAMCPPKK